MTETEKYRTFGEFYPYYLSEHTNRTSRLLHVVGTSIGFALLVAAIGTQVWWLVLVALVQGYALAWVGHFFFEHNKPATFAYPLYSLMGDCRMWWEILTGKLRL